MLWAHEEAQEVAHAPAAEQRDLRDVRALDEHRHGLRARGLQSLARERHEQGEALARARRDAGAPVVDEVHGGRLRGRCSFQRYEGRRRARLPGPQVELGPTRQGLPLGEGGGRLPRDEPGAVVGARVLLRGQQLRQHRDQVRRVLVRPRVRRSGEGPASVREGHHAWHLRDLLSGGVAGQEPLELDDEELGLGVGVLLDRLLRLLEVDPEVRGRHRVHRRHLVVEVLRLRHEEELVATAGRRARLGHRRLGVCAPRAVRVHLPVGVDALPMGLAFLDALLLLRLAHVRRHHMPHGAVRRAAVHQALLG
mmetsp:Transcript_18372/g.52288  ORF Transcript_18372/g.52288 Transcript_18372/m.52288 type:complete len:309 (-) Transcript_18372:821-1747(-)